MRERVITYKSYRSCALVETKVDACVFLVWRLAFALEATCSDTCLLALLICRVHRNYSFILSAVFNVFVVVVRLSWIPFRFVIDWLGISICHVFSLSGIITKVNGVLCCIVNRCSDIWLGLVLRLFTRICRVCCRHGLIQILCFVNICSVFLFHDRINVSFPSIYGLIRVFLFSVSWYSGVSMHDWLLYFSRISLSLEMELLNKFWAIAALLDAQVEC